ncbi:MAG: phosphoribosylanthranilate isomerase, partial [Deltaproteobacteria bacterium]|nr:phosphoribosylanthranilate isomerase [Deltaproteobacteria bacterium]
IKICGITNLDDAFLAVDLGADALGFIFYKNSKRFICSEDALRIISELPPFVTTVGVFVNQELEELKSIKKDVGFDLFQLHGDENQDYCRELGNTVIKAIRVKDSVNQKEIDSFPVQAFLFDTYSTIDFGGTGRSFNWELLKGLTFSKSVILSGGLTPENVADAIEIVCPYAVDVSSGVEDYPRKKNPVKLKAFIEAVRNGN